ncbi:hypothetical protein [Pontiella sulfatireligans]|uniref:Sulfatase N-terminal domain-containing protein n=1 Tax=Pontiella sulfatireligans TaxID=2750658 RepID=A0A6C2US40_9BACT|nr:hypothetical protein [Pontiella sulfatireligans]VGO22949.1 hypothetical protein SCARR_05048 [Pontiella sulfatireligans]
MLHLILRPYGRPSLFAQLILLSLALGGVSLAANKQPNILFFLADDHRADAVAAFGHPDAPPDLDGYSVAPICREKVYGIPHGP